MKKILLLGNGFIGKNLYNNFKLKHNVTLYDRSMFNVLNDHFLDNNFTHIIYCVGLKDVKYCENNKEEAFAINANAVKNLTKNLNNQKFIYISTDYVFDGASGDYQETSKPNPQTVYGKSKLLGENYTLNYQKSLVVRTSGVYGKNNVWLKWLLQEIKNKKEVECFYDIYNSPTYINNLAEMILDCLEYNGIMHLSGPEAVNRYELYKNVLRNYNLDLNLLKKTICNLNIPKNISLNTNLYQRLYKKKPTNISDGFYDLLKEQNEN